jgi:hypothetical protein
MLVYNKQFITQYAGYEHKSDTNVFIMCAHPPPHFWVVQLLKLWLQFHSQITVTVPGAPHTYCLQQRHHKLASLGLSK